MLLLAIVVARPVSAQSVQGLTYYTESYFPFNYSEDGLLKGISIDVLRLVWKELGVNPQPIQLLPWARGYELVQSQPGSVLFSMARTSEREGVFRWVGPIHTVRFVLKGKKSSQFEINTQADLHGKAIGTLIDDVGDVILGPLSKYARIEPVPDMGFSLKMLAHDRIDMVAYEEQSFDKLVLSYGLDPADYETVYVLKETGVYYALHGSTPPELVSQLQEALDAVKTTAEYQEILSRYLLEK